MRLKNKSGIILIVVLWIIIILTMLATGLARRMSIEIALTKHALGRIRAKYTALGGLHYALALISQDDRDAETRQFDTLYACGVRLAEEQSPQDLFQEISFGDGVLEIVSEGPGTGGAQFGMTDEERKINLNLALQQKPEILYHLLILVGYDETTASEILRSLKTGGGEEEAALEMGIMRQYAHLEEILLVERIPEDTVSRTKDFLTVCSRDGRLAINFDTAPATVLLALARSYAGNQTNTTGADADSLVDKMLVYRRGDDTVEATADDRRIEVNDMALNSKEKSIFLSMAQHQTRTARFLRIPLKGIDSLTGVVYRLEVVIDRVNNTILSWHRP